MSTPAIQPLAVRLAAPLVLLAGLALAACQDERGASATHPTDAASPTATAPATDVPTATGRPTTDDPDATTIEVTEPGARLEIGEEAVLPLFDGRRGTALARVAVTGIEPGTTAELQAAGVRNASAHALFYIRLDIELLSTGDEPFSSYSPLSNFVGLVGPFQANSLFAVGESSPCDIDAEFGIDAQHGDTLSGCIPVYVNSGTEVDGVRFTLEGDAGYDLQDGEPVLWR